MIGVGPVERDDAAHHLHDVAAEALGERGANLTGTRRGGFEDFHLQQFPRVERLLDGTCGGGREALLADVGDGFEGVREPAQLGALFRRELGDDGILRSFSKTVSGE